jgi:hypothetical protein
MADVHGRNGGIFMKITQHTMLKKTAIGLAAFLVFSNVQAIEVTVYNSNLGLVKDTRSLTLKQGFNQISITDVAAGIDATSVHFKSLTDPENTTVLEQNFQYDLLNQQKLLDKYIGKEIQLESWRGISGDKRDVTKGILLSNDGGRIVKVGDQILVNPAGNPILPALPEGLVLKPTLLWQLSADKGGKHNAEITYLTTGLNWSADYVLVTNATDDKLDLTSWVTLDNQSGTSYREAKLKLVAGDVNRVDNQPRFMEASNAYGMVSKKSAAPQFEEKSFFEYHLYTLQRPTTLQNNETKQIELASGMNVPVRKRFVYDGAQNVYWNDFNDYTRTDINYGTQANTKVWVTLEFKNSKENNLGMPLPKGRIRVYKKDSDGAEEFIGEDSIDHTPKDETVRVKMGKAFDVVGERKRVDFNSDAAHRTFTETFEIKIRNHKEEAVTVDVIEHLYRWTNWKLISPSQKFSKEDAQTVRFEVPIKKDGEAVVTYTVKYSW